MPAPKTLKQRLAKGEFILAPGVFDMVSAKIADTMGFNALYMTGYGVSASLLGQPDAGLATYTDMVGRARTIASGTTTPLIADADTGFGGLINVQNTVRGYEAAGVQAIQIEDQEMPKRCGHTPGRKVVPAAEMVQKIEVAVNARRSSQTLIIARTDARTEFGIDVAIERARTYAGAGADVLFVEAPESEREFAKVAEKLSDTGAYLLANMVPSGKSPEIDAAKLASLGFNISIFPTLGLMAMAPALKSSFAHLLRTGQSANGPTALMEMDDLHELVGFNEIWAFEADLAKRAEHT